MYGSPAVGQFRESQRSDYPVSVEFIIPAHNGRFWAIPLVGYLARVLVLIPHVVVMAFVSMLVFLAMLVLWIPVLFAGRYPRWGYALVGGWLRWQTRVNAFFLGLTDEYPPFRLSA
jgi:Domain of unknown function (DUF4389)